MLTLKSITTLNILQLSDIWNLRNKVVFKGELVDAE